VNKEAVENNHITVTNGEGRVEEEIPP